MRGDRIETVLLLEYSDTAAAQDVLGALPVPKAGLITLDVMPLMPNSGFGNLFETE